MKRIVVVLAASAIALSVTAATTHHSVRGDVRARYLRGEVVRLRSHFDSVDKELRAADVSGLTTVQKARRAELISWLRDYRAAGRFPENDRIPGRMVPFFRDSHGTLCAMAYLIDRSGHGDFVDKVAGTRNNAYIHELADDPTLVAWLDTWGLSVDEAARIQPQYGEPFFPPPPGEDDQHVDRSFAMASIGLGGLSMGSTALNLFAPSRGSGVAGFMSGAATIAIGANHLRDRNGNTRVAEANLVIGSVAVVSALYTLVFKVKPVPSGAAAKPVTETSWSPQLDVDGSGRFGVGMRARF